MKSLIENVKAENLPKYMTPQVNIMRPLTNFKPSTLFRRNVKMPYVGILRWHSPRHLKAARLWDIKLKRGVKKLKTTKTLPRKFKVNLSIKVCSNHFTAGE